MNEKEIEAFLRKLIFYAHSGRKIDVASNFVYRRRRADRERSSGVGVEYGSLSDCP